MNAKPMLATELAQHAGYDARKLADASGVAMPNPYLEFLDPELYRAWRCGFETEQDEVEP